MASSTGLPTVSAGRRPGHDGRGRLATPNNGWPIRRVVAGNQQRQPQSDKRENDHRDEEQRILGGNAEKIIRAYSLYLAGSAMGFERGWTSLLQILASRPADVTERRDHAMGRLGIEQRDYPFNRAYMYTQCSPVEPTDSARAMSCHQRPAVLRALRPLIAGPLKLFDRA
jgi:hypothetical protein